MKDRYGRGALSPAAAELLAAAPPAFATGFGLVSAPDSQGRGRYFMPLQLQNGKLLLATGLFASTETSNDCESFDGFLPIDKPALDEIFRGASRPDWPRAYPRLWSHPEIDLPPSLPPLPFACLTAAFRDEEAAREEGEYFLSDDWTCRYYRAQARLGYIAVAAAFPSGWRLLPQLQSHYALLDWENLRLDRAVRRMLSSGRMEQDDLRLDIDADPRRVLRELEAVWGKASWLHPPYRKLIERLAEEEERQADPGFRIYGTLLTAENGTTAVAGELGYTIGRTYTSLTGFMRRDGKRWNNCGKLQLVLLARRLKAAGIAFWNLGHPYMQYKLDLGAGVVSRASFLERWDAAVLEPSVDLR